MNGEILLQPSISVQSDTLFLPCETNSFQKSSKKLFSGVINSLFPRISSESEGYMIVRTLYCLGLSLLLAGCGSNGVSHKISSKATVDEVVRVCDGDTFVCNIDSYPPLIGKEIRVRLRGIDAPELNSRDPVERQRAWQAKTVLIQLLKNSKDIELRNISRGKYFRIIADVHVDKQPVTNFLNIKKHIKTKKRTK